MALQLSDDITLEYIDGGVDPRELLVTLRIQSAVDPNLILRAKRIFRSRKYNPKRSVEARIYSKPGRPKKLKQVAVKEKETNCSLCSASD